MLPRSVRVGTIYTSAAEVRDRSRPAHGAFYSTMSLPDVVYNILAGKGLTLIDKFQLDGGSKPIKRVQATGGCTVALYSRLCR